VIVTARVIVHPLTSKIVQVHVPAGRVEAVAPLCTGDVFQVKVYGAVPPLAETVAPPVDAPKQLTLFWALTVAVSAAAGCVMVALRVVVHPLKSVTEQVQVPATRPVAVGPFCTGVVLQLKE
jgi:hypothetical protein